MSPTPAVIPHARDGHDGWLNTETGRWLPRLAGADDAGDPPADPPAGDPKPADPPAPVGDPKPADPKPDDLGEGGKAAIDAERKARRDAEKRAKDAETKLKAKEDAELSETERLKKRADELESKADTATNKLREAKLLVALGEHGLTGARAKAAARLIDGVEYDADSDEPTNLQDALDSAMETYGDDLFTGATPKPKPPKLDGGVGNDDRDGPSLTAEELEMAKSFGMTPEEYAAYKDPRQPATTSST